MSHGPSDDKCEPNLIPLLDLVLQLVMFFMVCANFVMEEANASLQLPLSTQAQSITEKVPNAITLEVDKDGSYTLVEAGEASKREEKLADKDVALDKLSNRYKEDLRLNDGDRSKPPRTNLILVFDGRAPYGAIYDLEKAARDAGYTKVIVRTKMKDAVQANAPAK